MIRKTPLRRVRLTPDPVTPEVREAVLRRDGMCVLAKLERAHWCRDAWGTYHDAADLSKLSLEHVKDELAMGKRAPSDPQHLVALCAHANIGVPSKAQRAMLRQYLREVST
jgi:hypothetical protein